jgi:hypothetical protein
MRVKKLHKGFAAGHFAQADERRNTVGTRRLPKVIKNDFSE